MEQHQHGLDVICVGAGFTGSVLGFQDGQLTLFNGQFNLTYVTRHDQINFKKCQVNVLTHMCSNVSCEQSRAQIEILNTYSCSTKIEEQDEIL